MSTVDPSLPAGSPPLVASARGRAAGWWGLSFVVLLLLSAGMASVPGATDPVHTVRGFYTTHPDVVASAQVVGMVAALVFVPFVLTLRRGPGPRPAQADVEVTGVLVALAALLTAGPVLWLTTVSDTGSAGLLHGLTVLCDLTDVVLFLAIGLWAGMLVGASSSVLFRSLAGIVAVLVLARAFLLLARSSALEVAAPMAFVVLVLVLSVLALVRRTPFARG